MSLRVRVTRESFASRLLTVIKGNESISWHYGPYIVKTSTVDLDHIDALVLAQPESFSLRICIDFENSTS